jgi:hypothetical protein
MMEAAAFAKSGVKSVVVAMTAPPVLLQHGYADVRRGPDGKWSFVLTGK